MKKQKAKLFNILVIGGAGYIGSHTVVELINSGYRPIILDNFSTSDKSIIKRLEKLTDTKITFYPFNYMNTTNVEKIIKSENIEGVIHFAAYKNVSESVEKPLMYYSNNVFGFISLLETLTKLNLKHFVFSSSSAVYGNLPKLVATEDSQCSPVSPYGWSKYIDEIILHDLCRSSNLKGTALRYFNVVGAHESALIGEFPKSSSQNLMPAITKATAKLIQPLTVYGTDYDTLDGTCLRDYIHVVDLAKAHIRSLENQLAKSSDFEVYNIGTGKPTTVLELIKVFEKVNKVKVPYTLGNRRPGDLAALYASALKANKELGRHSTKTIEDATRDAWRWQLSLKDLK